VFDKLLGPQFVSQVEEEKAKKIESFKNLFNRLDKTKLFSYIFSILWAQCYKTFYVPNLIMLECFFHGKLLQPILVFVSKAEAC
jgi:hypothetical protein